MSIKIYEGKIIGRMTTYELHRWHKGLREQVNAKVKELFTVELANYTTRLIHYACLNNEYAVNEMLEKEFEEESFNSSYSAYTVAFLGLHRKAMKAMKEDVRGIADDSLDYRANLLVFPTRRRFFGILLWQTLFAIFLTEKTELYDMWKGYPRVRSHGYWDNTDRPERMPEWRWNDRYLEWREALGGYRGPLIENGLAYELVTDTPIVRPDDITPLIEPYEERVAKLAKDRVYKRILRKEYDAIPKEGRESLGVSYWLSVHKKVKAFLETEDAKHMLEQEQAFVSERIPEVIDNKVIQRELKEFCPNDEWSGREI